MTFIQSTLRRAYLFILPLAVPGLAYAAASTDGKLDNPLRAETLTAFLADLLSLVAQIAFPIIVLFIVYVGFRFVQHSATGDAEGLKEDRKYLFWAIVGALIVLGAQALSIAICGTVQQLGSGIRC